MNLISKMVLAVSAVALVGVSVAEAAPARVLTVKKRSFLDSGTKVYVGSRSNYLLNHNGLHRPLSTGYPIAYPR